MCIIQAHLPLEVYATQPFKDFRHATDRQRFPDRDARRLEKCDPIVTKHGQATKDQEFPNQDPSRPAKYETCDAIDDLPEDEDRDL